MGKMNSITTFIIADNQDITRRGLHGYITDLFETAQIIDVNSRQELVRTLAEHDTKAIVILDYTLFDLNGTDELLVIGKRFPETRWLLFSNELSEDFIRKLSIEENISMVLKENSGDPRGTALSVARRPFFLPPDRQPADQPRHQNGDGVGADLDRDGGSQTDRARKVGQRDCQRAQFKHTYDHLAQEEYLPKIRGKQCI